MLIHAYRITVAAVVAVVLGISAILLISFICFVVLPLSLGMSSGVSHHKHLPTRREARAEVFVILKGNFLIGMLRNTNWATFVAVNVDIGKCLLE